MQHCCCPMSSGNTSEFWGCSGGVDQPLTHPTMLEKSCVWGQQQCPRGTEMAANVVVSVQGKSEWWHSGGATLYPFQVICPVPWSPGLVLLWVRKYGHGLVGARPRASSLHHAFRRPWASLSNSVPLSYARQDIWSASNRKYHCVSFSAKL